MPRTVLGMTLYNNPTHVREATDSILAQTHRGFALLMLDDGSSDEVEAIAHQYERQDSRVCYWRHARRQGMVATWKEVVEIAQREHPGAEYFAWVSDHDRWDPRWLERMIAQLDAHPDAVLAYPQTLRISEDGALVDKEPRVFDTSGIADPVERWRRFAWSGFGSGDMVYGLMRMRALEAAGIFRPVLNPDRMLIAELSRVGEIHQVQEPLWSRRQPGGASVARQSTSLFAGATPPRFNWPPSLQHAVILRREGFTLPMIATYVLASGWRATRKTETSKSIGRGVDNVHFVKRLVKKGFHHAVYYTIVGARMVVAKTRRATRKAVYEVLTFTHRAGLR
ncbi:MAG: hypothetical protein DMF87_11520 [Acidobacteria bacterium]|nr:MAG: hypothetical protein DMF87_11520 [Acidobacteriota bacterium]